MSPQEAKMLIVQLTDIKPQTLKLLGSGTDNIAFLINGDWVFRFAKTESARLWLEKEINLLPKLKEVLTLEIPSFNYIGKENYVIKFVGYRKLQGSPLDKSIFVNLEANNQEKIIEKLAEFLRQVHNFPIDDLQDTGVKEEKFKGAFNKYQNDFPKQLARILSKNEVSKLETIFEEHIVASRSTVQQPVLLHADLKPEHIMFDTKSRQLTGIIDWGDVCIGDPTFDFMCLSQYYDKNFVQRLLNYFPEYQSDKVFSDIWFLSIVRALQDMLIDLELGDTIAVETCHEQLKILLNEK